MEPHELLRYPTKNKHTRVKASCKYRVVFHDTLINVLQVSFSDWSFIWIEIIESLHVFVNILTFFPCICTQSYFEVLNSNICSQFPNIMWHTLLFFLIVSIYLHYEYFANFQYGFNFENKKYFFSGFFYSTN